MIASTPSLRSVFLAGLVLLETIVSGCSRKATPSVVGSWRGEEEKETVEFRPDGTLRGVDKYGRALTGRYEFLDPDRVKIKMTTSSVDQKAGNTMIDNAEGICRIQIQGDQLTLSEEHGAATHYRKAK